MTKGKGLDGHHRATLEKIFNHPVSHNIQWHDVLSLLQSVATISEEHDGRYSVTLGGETETFDAPRHHDIDEQQVIDLRRMLKGAGITPGVGKAVTEAQGYGHAEDGVDRRYADPHDRRAYDNGGPMTVRPPR